MKSMNKYQRLAARTMNLALTKKGTVEHALFCLTAEVGELLSIYQKELQGHPFDELHAKYEAGDIFWALSEYCTAMGWELSDIAEMNIGKLRKRYPDGFDAGRSLNRKGTDI